MRPSSAQRHALRQYPEFAGEMLGLSTRLIPLNRRGTVHYANNYSASVTVGRPQLNLMRIFGDIPRTPTTPCQQPATA